MEKMIDNLLIKHKYSEPMTFVLQLFLEERPNIILLNGKLKKFGLTMNDLRVESLQVVMDYVEDILEDDVITQSEKDNLHMLKKYLQIQEGDFLKYHKEHEIQEIIYLQMQNILSDLTVDKNEAMMKTDLQKLFDLSYDQFLNFERKAIEEALKKGANIKDLDTFYKGDLL